MAELADLAALEMLAGWDQLVMMPSQGAPGRAHQLGALARLAHERAVGEEIGEWLAELEGEELEPPNDDIVRLARRDWERARRGPNELGAELSRAHADGQETWQRARANDDFAAFAPALRRNVGLARAYAQCLTDEAGSLYEELLNDYDFGLGTEELRRLFGALAAALPPLVPEARVRLARRELAVAASVQKHGVAATLRRIGVEEESWRVDVSAHPFTAWLGRRDTRLTTR